MRIGCVEAQHLTLVLTGDTLTDVNKLTLDKIFDPTVRLEAPLFQRPYVWNLPTKKRERVYIYASKTPADEDAWDEIGLQAGALPTGVLVGTVEIVDSRKTRTGYEWDLAKPVRLKRQSKLLLTLNNSVP